MNFSNAHSLSMCSNNMTVNNAAVLLLGPRQCPAPRAQAHLVELDLRAHGRHVRIQRVCLCGRPLAAWQPVPSRDRCQRRPITDSARRRSRSADRRRSIDSSGAIRGATSATCQGGRAGLAGFVTAHDRVFGRVCKAGSRIGGSGRQRGGSGFLTLQRVQQLGALAQQRLLQPRVTPVQLC